jgi:Protein of unknown function (DUF1232)/zinc-RING finger domain
MRLELSCSVCLQAFDTHSRRPWDLGCGHAFCEACLASHPRSFRTCPECRARTANPHVNVALLRLIDARGDAVPQSRRRETSRISHEQQQSGRRRDHHQDLPAIGITAPRWASGSQAPPPPPTNARIGRGGLYGAASAFGGRHAAKLVQLRSSLWTVLGPLLGLLYLLSPLDFIPDVIPFIGWLDDALVCIYIATIVYGAAAARADAGRGNGTRPHQR